jgi:molybdate transport system regulatory protein
MALPPVLTCWECRDAMPPTLIPRANLWIESNGRVVLSSWRVRLLEAIAATGSITRAAEQMGVQYRRAWEKLDEMEQGLGFALVDRYVGGPAGGGARLTQAGQEYVARFKQYATAIENLVAGQFTQAFDE